MSGTIDLATDPAVHAYLTELTERSRRILGSNLIGVYAAGSLALAAYQQGRSDIDIAIVVGEPLDRPTKERIIGALRHESLPCPARGLELVVYTAATAAAGSADPGFEVELNTGRAMDFRATYAAADRPARDGLFWYAIDRSILAEYGHRLTGPSAGEVFRSVSDGELVALLVASLRWHLGGDDAEPDAPAPWTADAVLNACRGWQRMRTGQWLSKVTAGQSVLVDPSATQSEQAVVERALAARTGGPSPTIGQARGFQRHVLDLLEELPAAPDTRTG